jgi:hypothetical protein
MQDLILTIPTDWALPAILITGAALCATACAMWRGGYAAGLADGRHAHLLHLEADEAELHDALEAAEKRFEEITRPRASLLPAPLCRTEGITSTLTEYHEREAVHGIDFVKADHAAHERRLVSVPQFEALQTYPESRYPEPGGYYAAPLATVLWGRFRVLKGGRSLQSYHESRADALIGTNPVTPAHLPFGTPTPC